MAKKAQIELSDEEGKIVEVYRNEQNKKNNEEAIERFIRDYKPLSEYKENNKEITVDTIEEKKAGTKAGSIIIPIAIGTVVGLAIGFLYAPKAGKETRTMIKDKAQITKAKAVKMVEQIKKISRDEVKIAKRNLGEFMQEARVPVSSSAKKGNGGSEV